MSIRAAEVYMGWVRHFILFHHKRHPKEMGTEEMREFLTHLVVLAVDGMSQSAGERGGFGLSAAHGAPWRTGPRHDVAKGGARASETHLATVELLHQGDAAESEGEMYLPYASAEACETTEAHGRVNQLREKIYASESSGDARTS